jgi:hypothetical protein
MARSERYDASQWRFMNSPEGQEKIRATLKNYLRSFLDSAPEGGELARVQEVLLMVKKYYEQEVRSAKEDGQVDLERDSKATEVLMALAPAMRQIRTDEEVEVEDAVIRNTPLPSPEKIAEKIEEWERFQRWLSEQGKENIWD